MASPYSRTYTTAQVAAAEIILADHLNAEFTKIFEAIGEDGITATEIDGGAVGTTQLATGAVNTTKIAAATLVTEADAIADSDNDTTLPTSAAVKDYVDTQDADTGLQLRESADYDIHYTEGDNTGSIEITVDNTFTDVDISSVVPGNATAVLLHVLVKDGTSGSNISIRSNGDTGTGTVSYCSVPGAGATAGYDCIIGVDSDRKVEMKASENWGGSADYIKIGIGGWWL